MPIYASCEYNCTSFDAVAAIKPHAVTALRRFKRFDVAPDDDFRPELLGLP